MTIESNRTVTITDGNLSINTNLAADGGIAFNGTAPKIFTINSGATTSLNNLTITKGAKATTMTLPSSIAMLNLTGTLSIPSGTLVANGVLTLKSSATNTASVAQLNTTNAAITGNVSVERYVTGANSYNTSRGNYTYRNYRLMTSPVNNGTTYFNLDYINNGAILSGIGSGNPTLYVYQEDYPGNNNSFFTSNFRGITGLSSTTVTVDATQRSLYPGTGFLFYFRGDKINNVAAKSISPYVAPESVVFTNTGTLNQGSILLKNWHTSANNLVRTTTTGNTTTEGLNLIGNPYASSIDWNTAAGYTTAGVDNFIYEFDEVTNQYVSFTRAGAATGNASNIIASGQGFFVHATSPAATFTFNETAKTTTQNSGNTLLLNSSTANAPVLSYLKLKLTKDSLNYDDIAISFTADGVVAPQNVPDLGGNGALESLSSVSTDNVNLAINNLSLSAKQTIVPLLVDATSTGKFSLNLSALQNLPIEYRIWLKDSYLNDSLDMRANTAYALTIDKNNAATFGSSRFQLVITKDPALALHLLSFDAAKVSKSIQVNVKWAVENENSATTFNVQRSTDNGKTFALIGNLQSNNSGIYSLTDPSPQLGINQYRLQLINFDNTVAYSNIVTIQYSDLSNSITGNMSVYPNPATDVVNLNLIGSDVLANSSYTGTIINSSGNVIKTINSTQPALQSSVSNLAPGTYYIQLINNNTKKLIGVSKFIKK